MALNSGSSSSRLCLPFLMPKDTKSVRGFGSAPLSLTSMRVLSQVGLSKPGGVSGGGDKLHVSVSAAACVGVRSCMGGGGS